MVYILTSVLSEGDQLLKTPHASVTPSAPPLEEVAVNSETSWTEENSRYQSMVCDIKASLGVQEHYSRFIFFVHLKIRCLL